MPRFNNSSGVYSPKYKRYLSVVSLSPRTRSRPGAERIRQGEGRFKPPPEDLFHLFKPCRLRAKQTHAPALSPADVKSKTNAREYAPAKFKTLATTVWKLCQFVNHPGAAEIQKQPQNLRNSSSTCGVFATSRLSRSASVPVHVDVRNGHGRARSV